jgi:adenosylhomocysteinase
MKDKAIVANSGHFDIEIDIRALARIAKKKRDINQHLEEFTMANGHRIYLMGQGRLANLACAEGHPSEVMSLSFCNQALACKYIADHKGKMPIKVIKLENEIDQEVAGMMLDSKGVKVDVLTPEQVRYLNSWQEGT